MKLFEQYRQRLNDLRRNHEGATIIIFAVALPVVIGAMALGVEYGTYRFAKAKLQNAADMAALAGAYEDKLTKNGGAVQLAAKGEAYENGFDLSNGKIQVFSPVNSGTYAGDDGVQVVLTLDQKRYFSNIFGAKDVTLTAEAIALLVEGDPICVLALSNNESGAVKVSGSTDVQVDGCTVKTNSSASDSFDIGGSGTMTASCIHSAGGVTTSSNLKLTECDEPCREGWPDNRPLRVSFRAGHNGPHLRFAAKTVKMAYAPASFEHRRRRLLLFRCHLRRPHHTG